MRAGPIYRPFQKALRTISRVLLPLVDAKKPQPAHFQVLNCWLNAGGCQLAREQACPKPNKHGRVFLFRDPRPYTFKSFPTTSYLPLRLLLLLLPLLLQLPQPLGPSGTTATLLLLLMSLLLLLRRKTNANPATTVVATAAATMLYSYTMPLPLLLLLRACYRYCCFAKNGDSQLQKQP